VGKVAHFFSSHSLKSYIDDLKFYFGNILGAELLNGRIIMVNDSAIVYMNFAKDWQE
jgi:hypothetical protein